ncbi:hypothetical protein JHL17_24085 [Azospirillum sp. YIM B02556]|uniref:Uncharacterized protein n=1 Tax=Azospirillum endophyticum TaxID=2800326 RepID=A0ABS1FAN6_9PROT|nr:hypothetical protein [Azospirillum endophyticum]MBK1840486.1 hypothetical protein [Azospirillum endophyticum]
MREYEDREDTELHIGIYSTQEAAMAAIERLRDKAGFQDWPECFKIHPTRLDEDGWAEGFFTTRLPVNNEAAEAFDLPAID